MRRLLDRERYPDVLAPDLRADDLPTQVERLRQDAPYVLAGYSMGGRIALHLALAQPSLVQRLVLVSTTAGIEGDDERAARAIADDALALEIEQDGVEAFAERWAAGPLFAGQPPAVAAAAREDRLRHSAPELAATLRSLSTGRMPPVWHRLGDLTMPATVIVGECDAKFRALGERLAAALPQGELVVVEDAGHVVHLEAPEAVAEALSG